MRGVRFEQWQLVGSKELPAQMLGGNILGASIGLCESSDWHRRAAVCTDVI